MVFPFMERVANLGQLSHIDAIIRRLTYESYLYGIKRQSLGGTLQNFFNIESQSVANNFGNICCYFERHLQLVEPSSAIFKQILVCEQVPHKHFVHILRRISTNLTCNVKINEVISFLGKKSGSVQLTVIQRFQK